MKNNSRRDFIKTGTALTVGATILSSLPFETIASDDMSLHTLPPLPYGYNALEPYIDELTMTIHHTKHHQAYVNNLNNALAKVKDGMAYSLDDILKNVSKFPEETRAAIRNNGGGHWNHSFFWKSLTPKTDTKPNQSLQKAIDKSFTSTDAFKEGFSKAAMGVFGSGWAWLMVTPTKELKIIATPNQDNPLMDVAAANGTPILGIDVWEHAYYLKHQNKRADYIKDFWSVVNWNFVNEEFEKAMK
jgi:Fe-Mn family superoxide dismutase